MPMMELCWVYLDCGITGHDWVMENHSDVHEVGDGSTLFVSSSCAILNLAVDMPPMGYPECKGSAVGYVTR